MRSALVVWLSLCSLLGTASASTIDYRLTAGTDVISFSLQQQPTPLASGCNFLANCFDVAPVPITINGTVVSGLVGFYLPVEFGGLTIFQGSTLIVNNGGPQLFTGTLANPTLQTFSNLQLTAFPDGGPQLNESFILNATVSAGVVTPEPSTITVLLGGVVLLSIVGRKHFRNATE